MNNRKELICAIERVLVTRAKKHSDPSVTYSELSDILNGLGFRTSQRSLDTYLGDLSQACIDRDYPPITALVIRKKTQMPGPGYFETFHSSEDENQWRKIWEADFQKVKEANWDMFLNNN